MSVDLWREALAFSRVPAAASRALLKPNSPAAAVGLAQGCFVASYRPRN